MQQNNNYYVYPAVLHFWKDEDGADQCSITFPDLPGLISGPGPGASFEEALEAAREGLALHLESMIEDGDEIPEPTPFNMLEYEKNPAEGGTLVVAMVDVVLSVYKNRRTEYSRVNITLPTWLKELGEQRNINFSKVLREGLISVLDLKRIER